MHLFSCHLSPSSAVQTCLTFFRCKRSAAPEAVPSSLCCWNKVVIHLGWVRTVSLKVEVELHWKHSFSSPPFSTHLLIPSSLNMGSFLCFCPPPLCFAFQTYGKPGVPGAERPYSDQDDLKEPEWVGSEETGTWWQQCPTVLLGRLQGIVTERSK